MRPIDRDLIRGGHYGQRSCEPHLKAEHMAAPTKPTNVKRALANSEPSTHGTPERGFPSSRQPLCNSPFMSLIVEAKAKGRTLMVSP